MSQTCYVWSRKFHRYTPTLTTIHVEGPMGQRCLLIVAWLRLNRNLTYLLRVCVENLAVGPSRIPQSLPASHAIFLAPAAPRGRRLSVCACPTTVLYPCFPHNGIHLELCAVNENCRHMNSTGTWSRHVATGGRRRVWLYT